ncbi:MAG: amidohydrolase family protein [Oscillospiraceae bacterium]|jgi:predicted TIM-barrel fold metal-dependent hydrolase|nr:amidohydrolase family protein [Oscillospiraceae bacterium]
MQIIDTHAHIFPPKIEPVSTRAIGDFYLRPMCHNASVDELLESGRRAGLTGYVVFSAATTTRQVERINDFIIEQCGLHPEFFGAGTMHKDYENFENELGRLYDAGIRGIKLHPDFQKFCIDDEKMLPVFGCLESLGMFVVTHSGDYRYPYSHPDRVAKIARLYPKMNVVAAHFGGWSMWDYARGVFRGYKNVYFDTSSTYGFTGTDAMKKAFAVFDPSHIFFGVDFPMWDHEDELRVIRSLGLPDKLTEEVLGQNFLNFFAQYN